MAPSSSLQAEVNRDHQPGKKPDEQTKNADERGGPGLFDRVGEQAGQIEQGQQAGANPVVGVETGEPPQRRLETYKFAR